MRKESEIERAINSQNNSIKLIEDYKMAKFEEKQVISNAIAGGALGLAIGVIYSFYEIRDAIMGSSGITLPIVMDCVLLIVLFSHIFAGFSYAWYWLPDYSGLRFPIKVLVATVISVAIVPIAKFCYSKKVETCGKRLAEDQEKFPERYKDIMGESQETNVD